MSSHGLNVVTALLFNLVHTYIMLLREIDRYIIDSDPYSPLINIPHCILRSGLIICIAIIT